VHEDNIAWKRKDEIQYRSHDYCFDPDQGKEVTTKAVSSLLSPTGSSENAVRDLRLKL